MMLALGEAATRARVTPPIDVILATPADQTRWEQFVESCPSATFFHRFGWKTIIEEVFRHRTFYLIAQRAGQIEGVLPLAQVKSLLFGNGLTSLPFGVYGGPAATSEAATAALTRLAVDMAKDLGVGHLELRNRAALNPDWPRQDLYVTFRRPILAEEEGNMLAIPRKQRAMVRKGIKAGLRGEIDTDVERFFELYADNMRRHGTPPFAKRYFAALKRVFNDQVEVLTVTSAEGKALSSVMSFYFRDEVLPYYAGDHVDARDLAANDFKYWELMRRACARKLGVFDYGRSKQGTGSFHFKKNWGFDPEPLHYEYWLRPGRSIPQNNPANPKYRAFIQLWRRLPLGVTNAIGPSISKYLG